MMDIDTIMGMLDCENPEEVQAEGRRLASKVKCLAAFMQPSGKEFWKNCALVLCEHSDKELRPYVLNLLMWLEDINWPGALTILKRLQVYQDKKYLEHCIDYISGYARSTDYPDSWLKSLDEILHPTEFSTYSDTE